PLDLHSFPTRRSSDLRGDCAAGLGRGDPDGHELRFAKPLLRLGWRAGSGAKSSQPYLASGLNRQRARILKALVVVPATAVLWNSDRKSTRLNSSHVAI